MGRGDGGGESGIYVLWTLCDSRDTFYFRSGGVCLWPLAVDAAAVERLDLLHDSGPGCVARHQRDVFHFCWNLVHRGICRVLVRASARLDSAAFTTLALFTGFFENPKGAGDFVRAFDFWSKTGNDGNGHGKEMAYWIKTMWRYEWLLCMGLAVGALAALPFRWGNRAQRVLLLTGFGSFLAYSIIHYKTPWLLLSFWSLFFFMIPRLRRGLWKPVIALLLLVSLVHDARQAWDLNFHKFADSSEPYVYVQTTSDYSKVMDVLQRKIKEAPDTKNAVILIMVQDPWPLPYDVALFPNLKYSKLEDIDRNLDLLKQADLILADGSHLEGLRKVFPKKFARMRFQLRDAYESGWALFDFEKFQPVLSGDVELEEPAR